MFSRYCVVLVAIFFGTAISGAVFAQTDISVSGQSQRFALQPQTQQDIGLNIARGFGTGSRPTQQPPTVSQTATSAYPPKNAEEQQYRLPESNPLLSSDIPERQRQTAVWSPESYEKLQASHQTQVQTTLSQTPPPTQPPHESVVQPQYQNINGFTPITMPILQASGEVSESESILPAVQPPPLVPRTDPIADSDSSPFVEVREQGAEGREQGAGGRDEEVEEVSNTIPEARSLESEAISAKYSDRPMPKFYAQGEQKEEAAEKSKDKKFGFLPGSTGPTMTVLSSLAIVLGVFFVLVWLMKRTTPRQAGLLPTEVFEKLGSVPLSPKMHLQLFRLGGKLVLVSVTSDGMETVAEVTDPDEVIHLIGLCKQNDPKSASAAFRQVLKQYTGENGQQLQQQMTGGYVQQPMQPYPAQQYQQQAVRRPVGVVRGRG